MRDYDPGLDNDTNERGTTGPFNAWEGDHTALVHVLWHAKHRGLDLAKDDAEIASMILHSRWLAAQINAAKADAWHESRETLGADMLKPIGEDGMRASTPNPYKAQQIPST